MLTTTKNGKHKKKPIQIELSKPRVYTHTWYSLIARVKLINHELYTALPRCQLSTAILGYYAIFGKLLNVRLIKPLSLYEYDCVYYALPTSAKIGQSHNKRKRFCRRTKFMRLRDKQD